MEKTSLGMSENVEGLLSYVLGWLTGILFLILEKENKFVRFHAMQSTITFLGFTVISIILGSLAFVTVYSSIYFVPFVAILFGMINTIIFIVAVITWIVCMVKAYQGEKFKLPIVGGLAESLTK